MNLAKKFFENASNVPEKTFLMSKENGNYVEYKWNEVEDKVSKLASFFINKNITENKKVALISINRKEWFISDLAILSSGCICLPIYPTSTSGQIEYILKDADCDVIIVENLEQYEKIKNFNFIKLIISFEKLNIPDDRIFYINEIFKYIEPDKEKINKIIESKNENDILTLIYTSGTTGFPKGVYLTHGNILHNVEQGIKFLPINENDIFLSHLPLSHAFERTVGQFAPMYHKSIIAYAEKIDTIGENLKEVKPTIFVSVPRLYEKILEKVIEKVREASFLKKKLFYSAKELAQKYAESISYNKPFSLFDKIKYNFFEKKIYSKLREGIFGGRMRIMVSGGAKLPYEIGLFYNGIGIPLLEGYGLTETSPVISVNPYGKNKIGTVGLPLPKVEVKIAEDGELLVKGPNVFKGYHNKPEENKLAFKNGWFCTGDIAEIDESGYIKITDRKKDLIVTSGGKNIAPQAIENILKEDPFISEVMVYGDGKKFLSALIVPNFEALYQWAEERDLKFSSNEEMIKNEKIIRLIKHRIEKRSQPLARYEKIKKFILLPKDFSMEEGEVTPTLKLRRKIITEKYKKELDALYEE